MRNRLASQLPTGAQRPELSVGFVAAKYRLWKRLGLCDEPDFVALARPTVVDETANLRTAGQARHARRPPALDKSGRKNIALPISADQTTSARPTALCEGAHQEVKKQTSQENELFGAYSIGATTPPHTNGVARIECVGTTRFRIKL